MELQKQVNSNLLIMIRHLQQNIARMKILKSALVLTINGWDLV